MDDGVIADALRSARIVDGEIRSALSPLDQPAGYDSFAASYDRVVGNGLYNRLVWGADIAAYTGAARTVVDAAAGPMIDVGCGSLVFTHAVYRDVDPRFLLLTDRSVAMLRRAAHRLPDGQFLQADAFALPVPDRQFAAVMSWGMLHLFGSASGFLAELRRVAAPGAIVAISVLTLTGRVIGDAMLRQLHRAGEAAVPERHEDVTAAFARHFSDVSARRHGSMLVLTGHKAAGPGDPGPAA